MTFLSSAVVFFVGVRSDFADEFEDLFGYVLGCEAEFFVEHFVGGGGSEAAHAEYFAFGAYDALKRCGKSGSEAEAGYVAGQHAVFVFLCLLFEKTYGGEGYDARGNASGFEKHGNLAQQ